MLKKKQPGRPRGIPKGRALLPGLRTWRELRRLTREDLLAQLRARGVQASASTLANWERGEARLLMLYVQILGALLHASEADLLAVPPLTDPADLRTA